MKFIVKRTINTVTPKPRDCKKKVKFFSFCHKLLTVNYLRGAGRRKSLMINSLDWQEPNCDAG